MRTIQEAAAALRAREVSCEELVRQALAQEEKHRSLNAFITLTPEDALASAQALDRELAASQDRGPLHGIPVAHKDLYFTAGIRTTNGSKLFEDFVPDHDAVAYTKLKEAGTISIGKLNMHELAYGISSSNPHFGPVRNPHDPERIPGGSSGGSGVAVATGMVYGATGSDTGGSIRIPASFCGTVGFKPTFGRVSLEGCFPLGATLDHMGPLAGSVEDAALLTGAMQGQRMDLAPSAKLRVGLPENFYFEGVEPEVRDNVKAAAKRAESLGATVIPVQAPDPEELMSSARTILLLEAATQLQPYLHRRAEFGDDVYAALDSGTKVTPAEYIRAQAAANRLRAAWARLFDEIDILITPTTPTVAPRIGQKTISMNGTEHDTRLWSTRFCRGVNLLGYPAASLPCGKGAHGLPVGLQLIGGLNRDNTVLNFAAAL